MEKQDMSIMAGNRKVRLTHLDKVYWPDEKITKGDVINYYNELSKYILPYLKGRPQSLKRQPNGLNDQGFFQKDAGEDAPDWVVTEKFYSESTQQDVDYIICNNKPTLLYLNNLGCIELNPWNSKISKPDYPDYLIMDIDPSKKNNFDDVIDVALAIKEILDELEAVSYCKTSGATGIHVYVPLGAKYSYEHVRGFAKLMATKTQKYIPDITTMERSLSKREKNKVYIDYLQNSRGQTLVSVYSLRSRPGATVSTPLRWAEVKHGLRPESFNIHTIPKRITKLGDLFEGVLGKGINLKKALTILEK